ncbi:MAG: hypothetical protein ACLS3Y_10865 [Collinsella sp.]
MGRASCGSVFRNPPDASVGKLIEDCGLKVFRLACGVSPVRIILSLITEPPRPMTWPRLLGMCTEGEEAYGIELTGS